MNAGREGHCYLPYEEIYSHVRTALQEAQGGTVTEEEVKDRLRVSLKEQRILIEKSGKKFLGRSLCRGLQRRGLLPAGAGCGVPHRMDALRAADSLREQEPRRRREGPGEGPAFCIGAAAPV